jgi:cob(I)alamin adenosyltransferase
MAEPVDQADENAAANEKRRRHKEAKDRILAKKTLTGGLLIVHTGKGKGKTTAAMGMIMRCIGHGMKVGIVQFVKGRWETGERTVLDHFPDQIDIAVMGEGFTWETQDRGRDIAAAQNAWQRGKEMIASGKYGFVLLDEINIVLRYDYLPIDEIVAVLKQKPETVHVACTGRNAKKELIEAADLVTEMTEIKHHFRAGYKAQSGIEF